MIFTKVFFALIIGYLFYLLFSRNKKEEHPVRLAESYLDLIKEKPMEISQKELINRIEVVYLQDDFGRETIYFQKITLWDFDYLPMFFEKIGQYVSHNHVGLSISADHEGFFLTTIGAGAIIDKSSRIILLFENSKSIDTTEKIYSLSLEELKLIAENKLSKWKVVSKNDFIVGDNSFFYHQTGINNKDTAQKILMKMGRDMLRIAKAHKAMENITFSKN